MMASGERTFVGHGRKPPHRLPGAWTQWEPYVASAELIEAVNLGLFLRRPLLLEGEPGCGKTRLANAVAFELGLPLKTIHVRSTSRARDLLYTFNAVGRLYDIQERAAAATLAAVDAGRSSIKVVEERERFVEYRELGEAIRLSANDTPSVVLIDEIDKADIDFPNDLLDVLDRMRFAVDEVPGLEVDALGQGTRAERREVLPIVIVTSNREKELPAPFLRRCLYTFIPFPEEGVLRAIIERHSGKEIDSLVEIALRRFWELRDQSAFRWRKLPGTSELLDWLASVEEDSRVKKMVAKDLAGCPLGELPHLEALVKTEADLKALKSQFKAASAGATGD